METMKGFAHFVDNGSLCGVCYGIRMLSAGHFLAILYTGRVVDIKACNVAIAMVINADTGV